MIDSMVVAHLSTFHSSSRETTVFSQNQLESSEWEADVLIVYQQERNLWAGIMSVPSQSSSPDPMLASTLLNLDSPFPGSNAKRLGYQRSGLHVQGLDPPFTQLWRGGSVVGVGATDSDTHEVRATISCMCVESIQGIRQDAN
jgi:hypothetical protein